MKVLKKATAIGLVSILALAGCGRSDNDATSKSSGPITIDDKLATGEITIWAMGEESENLPGFVDAFTKENPDATVKVTTIPWADVRTKVQTAVAAEKVPDAIMIGSSQLPMIVSTGGLAQVPDGLVNADDFFEGATDSTIADGKTYGVPWYVESRVLYYRSDLAAAAGLEAPKTWEEMTTFAKGLKASGSTHGLQLPMGDKEDPTQVILPFYAQAGGSVLNAAGDAYDLDNQQMIDALDYYASFFKDGLTPLSGYSDTQNGAFIDGSNPAFISGPWMINVLAEIKDAAWVEANVATAVIPAGKENNESYIGGAHLGVFDAAKNPESAWKFIKWLAQEETQQKWYDATNDLPALTSAWEYEPLTSNKRVMVINDQLKNTVAPPTIPSWDELSGFIETEAEKVANGTVTSKDAAKAIQAKADELGLGW